MLCIHAVCQLISKTIADPPPQFYEGLSRLHVYVRLLGKEVRHDTHVGLRLPPSHEGNGLSPVLIEVSLASRN